MLQDPKSAIRAAFARFCSTNKSLPYKRQNVPIEPGIVVIHGDVHTSAIPKKKEEKPEHVVIGVCSLPSIRHDGRGANGIDTFPATERYLVVGQACYGPAPEIEFSPAPYEGIPFSHWTQEKPLWIAKTRSGGDVTGCYIGDQRITPEGHFNTIMSWDTLGLLIEHYPTPRSRKAWLHLHKGETRQLTVYADRLQEVRFDAINDSSGSFVRYDAEYVAVLGEQRTKYRNLVPDTTSSASVVITTR